MTINKNVLITGGLGFIGRHLRNELVVRGYDVYTCDLVHSAQPYHTRCDVADFRQFEALFHERQYAVVYHLAAEFGRRNGEEYWETMWRTNVNGTRNAIELQKRYGFKMVFASTSEVYGNWAGVMSEDVPDRFVYRLLNDYAISKWVNEQQIVRSEGATVRVRLFNVYGPGEFYTPYRSAVCNFIYHALTGQKFVVYRNHTRSNLYVTDAVRTLAKILDNFVPGRVYNIASEDICSMERVAKLVLSQTGRSDALAEYRDEFEANTTAHKRPDVALAKEDLQHRCDVNLTEGIRRTVAWMRQTLAPSSRRLMVQ